MRFDVRVEAVGSGPVDAAAVARFRAHLPEAREVGAEPGAWWVQVFVEGESSDQAGERACVQVQAAALLAGVPDWPITSVSVQGRRERPDGVVEVSFDSSDVWAVATSGGDTGGGDEGGVREPRGPLPPYPSAGAEAEAQEP